MYPEYKEKVVLFQVVRGLFFKSDNLTSQVSEEESKQGQGRPIADKSTMWLFDQVDSLRTLN